jgi:DNA-binding ferritin-like protein
MRLNLEELYASILNFFMKAYDWYIEGKLSHILHGVSQPWHRDNADLVDEIAKKSRNIDQLAEAASQAELRDMHKKIEAIQSQLQLVVASRTEPRDLNQLFTVLQSQHHSSATKMDDIIKQMACKFNCPVDVEFQKELSSLSTAYHAIQSSSLIEYNQRVSDLQMSQILAHLSNVPLDDPIKSLQYHLFFRKRRAQATNISAVTNPFWLSSRFQALFSTEDSALALMKGNFATRQALQDFCVDVIEHLRSSNIPTLWALKKTASFNKEQTHSSIVNLLKYLISQAIRLNENLKTEKTMAWRCAQFHRANTAAELFQLLLAALDGLGRQVYLVIDLDTIEESLQSLDGFNIVSAFLQSFHASQSPKTRLKIIIVRYRATEMQLDGDDALAVIPVRAVGRGRQQGKEARQKVKTAVGRGITRRRN